MPHYQVISDCFLIPEHYSLARFPFLSFYPGSTHFLPVLFAYAASSWSIHTHLGAAKEEHNSCHEGGR